MNESSFRSASGRVRERSVIHREPDGTIRVTLGADAVRIEPDARGEHDRQRADFAAWLLLPVAMRRGVDLVIEGAGSEATVRNAGRLAQIWSQWLPGHFTAVDVSFTQTWTEAPASNAGDLCFYSGGVDSTYGILRRFRAGHQQSLLTVHGLEYRHGDSGRFADLLEKTAPFANLVAFRRLLVRTDVKDLYRRERVDPKGIDVAHGFILAAMGFLYSNMFGRAVLSADYKLDQQFAVHPWGTNAITNPLFSDGTFSLHTEGEDVTRTEKCGLLLESPEALASLTFCVDYSARPHNCGRCQKCVRTKAMFLAATGGIPPICRDMSLAPDCLASFDLSLKSQRAFFVDLHASAAKSGRLDEIPGLRALHAQHFPRDPRRSLTKRIKRFLRGK